LKEELSKYIKKYRPLFSDSSYAELLIQYYIDGKRTVAEIAEKVMMDCRKGDMEAVHQYIQLLMKLDLLNYVESVK
jgi:hypothetical protein